MAVDLARVDLWANAGKPARYSVARELTETVNTGGAGNRTGGPSTTAGGALGNNSGGSCRGFVGSGSNGNARTAVLVAEGAAVAIPAARSEPSASMAVAAEAQEVTTPARGRWMCWINCNQL